MPPTYWVSPAGDSPDTAAALLPDNAGAADRVAEAEPGPGPVDRAVEAAPGPVDRAMGAEPEPADRPAGVAALPGLALRVQGPAQPARPHRSLCRILILLQIVRRILYKTSFYSPPVVLEWALLCPVHLYERYYHSHAVITSILQSNCAMFHGHSIFAHFLTDKAGFCPLELDNKSKKIV